MKRSLLTILKSLMTLIMSLYSFNAYADDATIDGICYDFNADTHTAEVTYSSFLISGSVSIPSTVTWNGTQYFVTSIGSSAFTNCRGLTSVTIPNTVTSIAEIAFQGCSNMTSVTIPNSVTSIGNGVFFYCSNLVSISVESGNTVYDSRDNCNAIIETNTNTLIIGCKTTAIPNSVTSIGYCAFCYCSDLTSITIPNSVTSIGGSAFRGCI